MGSINVTISGPQVKSLADIGIRTGYGREEIKRIRDVLSAVLAGQTGAKVTFNASTTNAVAATSTVTATTSGNLGTVINGTTVTTTFVTSQDVTATNAVADVNANTTVNKFVRATKAGTGTFLLTALVPGALGNCCTVTVTGTGASATGSGKLTGGAGNDGAFSAYDYQ